jgi:hypothetical protein
MALQNQQIAFGLSARVDKRWHIQRTSHASTTAELYGITLDGEEMKISSISSEKCS